MREKDFQNYICKKNDEIENLAYELLRAMVTPHLNVIGGDRYLDWDISMIRSLLLDAEDILKRYGIDPCIHSEDCYK